MFQLTNISTANAVKMKWDTFSYKYSTHTCVGATTGTAVTRSTMHEDQKCISLLKFNNSFSWNAAIAWKFSLFFFSVALRSLFFSFCAHIIKLNANAKWMTLMKTALNPPVVSYLISPSFCPCQWSCLTLNKRRFCTFLLYNHNVLLTVPDDVVHRENHERVRTKLIPRPV